MSNHQAPDNSQAALNASSLHIALERYVSLQAEVQRLKAQQVDQQYAATTQQLDAMRHTRQAAAAKHAALQATLLQEAAPTGKSPASLSPGAVLSGLLHVIKPAKVDKARVLQRQDALVLRQQGLSAASAVHRNASVALHAAEHDACVLQLQYAALENARGALSQLLHMHLFNESGTAPLSLGDTADARLVLEHRQAHVRSEAAAAQAERLEGLMHVLADAHAQVTLGVAGLVSARMLCTHGREPWPTTRPTRPKGGNIQAMGCDPNSSQPATQHTAAAAADATTAAIHSSSILQQQQQQQQQQRQSQQQPGVSTFSRRRCSSWRGRVERARAHEAIQQLRAGAESAQCAAACILNTQAGVALEYRLGLPSNISDAVRQLDRAMEVHLGPTGLQEPSSGGIMSVVMNNAITSTRLLGQIGTALGHAKPVQAAVNAVLAALSVCLQQHVRPALHAVQAGEAAAHAVLTVHREQQVEELIKQQLGREMGAWAAGALGQGQVQGQGQVHAESLLDGGVVVHAEAGVQGEQLHAVLVRVHVAVAGAA